MHPEPWKILGSPRLSQLRVHRKAPPGRAWKKPVLKVVPLFPREGKGAGWCTYPLFVAF